MRVMFRPLRRKPWFSFEELSEEDKGKVGLLFAQLEKQVPEENREQVYPMILMQMKGSRNQVPDSEINVYRYVTQEMTRRIEAMQSTEESDPAEDPIEAPAGG